MSEATPQERIQAFIDAVDEELVLPVRRYSRGFRRGILLGVALGLVLAPRPGAETRAKCLALWRQLSRLTGRPA